MEYGELDFLYTSCHLELMSSSFINSLYLHVFKIHGNASFKLLVVEMDKVTLLSIVYVIYNIIAIILSSTIDPIYGNSVKYLLWKSMKKSSETLTIEYINAIAMRSKVKMVLRIASS